MNLGDLRTFARLYVPGAKSVQAISNVNINKLINEMAIDVAFRTGVLQTHKDFKLTAEIGRYNISEFIDDYLVINESGIWWLDGNSKWQELDPKTKESMDNEYPQWRNDSSGDPSRYFIEADILELHNKPDTTTTNGCRVYYGRKPEYMTKDSHFPFHKDNDQTTEIPQFRTLDDCIFAGCEWKLKKLLSKSEVEVVATARVEYLQSIADRMVLLNRRPDIANTEETIWRGPNMVG